MSCLLLLIKQNNANGLNHYCNENISEWIPLAMIFSVRYFF